jgi:molybdopterin-guanine dinucleotide biosynthesis protein A
VKHYAAAILAGGRSERLGHDKALLRLENQYLLDRVFSVVSEVISEIRVLGDPRPVSSVESDLFVPDLIANLGPIGGLYTALNLFKVPVFLLSCDMPMIQAKHLRNLLRCADQNYLVTAAVGQRGVEPLFAIYQTACLPLIESSIKSGDYALYKIIKKAKAKFVEFKDSKNNYDIFFNINTLSDYKKALYLKKQNQDHNG